MATPGNLDEERTRPSFTEEKPEGMMTTPGQEQVSKRSWDSNQACLIPKPWLKVTFGDIPIRGEVQPATRPSAASHTISSLENRGPWLPAGGGSRRWEGMRGNRPEHCPSLPCSQGAAASVVALTSGSRSLGFWKPCLLPPLKPWSLYGSLCCCSPGGLLRPLGPP